MNEDLADWRYRVTLMIEDDLRNTVTSETMGCDRLGEIRDFVESITVFLENQEDLS